MKRLLALAVLLIAAGSAHADNPILSGLCSQVDCLNNATAKSGYSFQKKEMLYGGFTDLKQDWYLSPAPGFDAARGETPNLDINAVFKIGKLMADKVPYVKDFVTSHPFTQGLLKYATVGVTGSYDYSKGSWYDMEWVGATLQIP